MPSELPQPGALPAQLEQDGWKIEYRDWFVDRAPPLKSMFIRQAAGLAGEVPRLLKGEAL